MINPEYFNNLNNSQKEAVYMSGPLLIVAGAGSGKTKSSNLSKSHILDKNKAFPNEILTVTFTNKAAREMQIRVTKIMGNKQVGFTLARNFCSICAKILRRHAKAAGLNQNFTIIDQDDQNRLIKTICNSENIDIKKISPNYIISLINKWKNNSWYPNDVILKKGDGLERQLLKIYKIYQEKLLNLNTCDFGDLILHCVSIFEKNIDINEMYSKKLKYILVDEYQDANFIQSKWLKNS